MTCSPAMMHTLPIQSHCPCLIQVAMDAKKSATPGQLLREQLLQPILGQLLNFMLHKNHLYSSTFLQYKSLHYHYNTCLPILYSYLLLISVHYCTSLTALLLQSTSVLYADFSIATVNLFQQFLSSYVGHFFSSYIHSS